MTNVTSDTCHTLWITPSRLGITLWLYDTSICHVSAGQRPFLTIHRLRLLHERHGIKCVGRTFRAPLQRPSRGLSGHLHGHAGRCMALARLCAGLHARACPWERGRGRYLHCATIPLAIFTPCAYPLSICTPCELWSLCIDTYRGHGVTLVTLFGNFGGNPWEAVYSEEHAPYRCL